VQVVLEVTHLMASPVVGAVANPKMVFEAVAALPHVVVKLPEAGYVRSVPAFPELPRDTAFGKLNVQVPVVVIVQVPDAVI